LSEVLENLPQSEFLALKQAIKKKLDEKHKRIASKASSLFQLAYEEKGNFGLKQQITAALNRLTKQDLLALLKRSLSPKTEKSLTLELFAKGPAPELLEGGIKNIEVFKQSRSYQSTQ
jgi:secreted Zn-dependent insulinase-like peptidase